MNDKRLLKTGLAGTAVTAVCCFTPVLVIGLAGLGITSVLWLDYVLFPALAMFIGMVIYALVRLRRSGMALFDKGLGRS